MKLVEIIRGEQTSEETLARAYDYVLALGKTPIVVNDSRGFFTSRVFSTYVMEGATMLAEGIAAPLAEKGAEIGGGKGGQCSGGGRAADMGGKEIAEAFQRCGIGADGVRRQAAGVGQAGQPQA